MPSSRPTHRGKRRGTGAEFRTKDQARAYIVHEGGEERATVFIEAAKAGIALAADARSAVSKIEGLKKFLAAAGKAPVRTDSATRGARTSDDLAGTTFQRADALFGAHAAALLVLAHGSDPTEIDGTHAELVKLTEAHLTMAATVVFGAHARGLHPPSTRELVALAFITNVDPAGNEKRRTQRWSKRWDEIDRLAAEIERTTLFDEPDLREFVPERQPRR